jgi:GH24 family phage-related lysozyme (muramidase)
MKNPYRIRIRNGLYHIGYGKGGGINTAMHYSKEKMEEVKASPDSFYNENKWTFVEMKEDGTFVDVPTS